MNIYSSSTMGDAHNTQYENRIEICHAGNLVQACMHDYTAAEFQGGIRSNKNFRRADVIIMDIDNSHSDDPNDWVWPKDIQAAFPGVAFYIHYSRNHMKEKDGQSARPRFHLIIPIRTVEDADLYAAIKKTLAELFPYFDNNALDAARFFFGTENPQVEVFQGTMDLTQYLEQRGLYPVQSQPKPSPAIPQAERLAYPPYNMPASPEEIIPQGQRNQELYNRAVKLLKRYGDTKEAYERHLKNADMCSPRLENREIGAIWTSAQKFYTEIISQSKDYVPPEQYNDPLPQSGAGEDGGGAEGPPSTPNGSTASNAAPVLQYKPSDFTDVGQALKLKEQYGQIVIHVPSFGNMVYTDKVRWKVNDPEVRMLAHKLTALQLEEAYKNLQFWKGQVVKPTLGLDDEAVKKRLQGAKEYLTFANSRRKSSNISATLKEFTALVNIDVERLDAQPYLLCTPEATYDLTKGLAGKQDNSPNDYITKVTRYSPSDAGKDIWDEFLNEIFCGDAELIEYVQLICGLAAIGQVKVEALFIAYGDGRNGKSTFWNTIGHVLGDYFGHISAQSLAVSKISSGNVGAEMANLQGKRLCIASESREGSMLNESLVKQITSTDDIFANPKYKDPFSFRPSHTTVLYTNHLPKVSSMDDGTWRRLVVIPFDAKIQPSNDRKNYAEYLETNCGGSIMAWIIDGARKIIELDYALPTPACVQKAIGAYRSDSDWLQQFLDQCCEIGAGYEVPAGTLYQEYRNYAQNTNSYTRGNVDFYNELNNRGFTSYKKRNRKFYQNIKLRDNP